MLNIKNIYFLIGEGLGVMFIISLIYLFLNNRELSLIDMIKMVGILYVPQRIGLYLQCKNLVDRKIRRMEVEERG